MENEKGINRKWIAAQGPLPNTVQDFYQMIWERSATKAYIKPTHTFQFYSENSIHAKQNFYFSETELIIMVTQVVERGRRKCDQYWDSEEKQFGNLKVKMTSEDVTLRKNGIIERTLSLSSGAETREGMTYISYQYVN